MFFKNLGDEISGIIARDPAARSRLEVVLAYPGFHALLFYRLAHGAWSRGWLVLGRWLSHVGRVLTGIEIHPGAKIGRRLFIDHGMGVVIGETAEVGDDVTLYQGVTLGGTSLNKGKRHPTLGDRVIVGAGAQILGPIKVGDGARVGANAVVVNEVPPGVTMVGIPARAVPGRAATETTFCAYGLSSHELPDPVARAMNGLLDELTTLKARIAELEAAQPSVEAGGRPPPDPDDTRPAAAAE
ncbi:MAG: serine O-acetyltransferase [Proteobacteria bacterium]|nr:serine O-acetyltransferase [Pseudomonadota bacterium]